MTNKEALVDQIAYSRKEFRVIGKNSRINAAKPNASRNKRHII